MRGVNIDKIDNIIRMILSKDFETQKLGLSLALEEFPFIVLEYKTQWQMCHINGGYYDVSGHSFLKLKDIIKLAIDYKEDDLYFWRCTIMVYSVVKSHNLTTVTFTT